MLIKYIPLVFTILLTFVGTNSCSLVGDSDNSVELGDVRINHYRQTGIGEGLYLVYLIQEEEKIGSEGWEYLYDGIEGFDYELGYIYDLKVRKVKIDDPPMDASSVKYILVNVRSKEKVAQDEDFRIYLKSFGENFVTETGNELSLLSMYNIDCSTMCEKLSEDLSFKENVVGTFLHGPGESLVLQSISYESRFD